MSIKNSFKILKLDRRREGNSYIIIYSHGSSCLVRITGSVRPRLILKVDEGGKTSHASCGR